MNKYKYLNKLIGLALIIFTSTQTAYTQTVSPQQRLSTERNGSSQRYEINQTFDGQAYYKDNNVWVYTKEFADLFGMPAKYIEDVQGVAAAAFRIEDSGYQECGFGGQANACRKVEQCLIDLYFDESKTPLPWASDIKTQWLPWYSSMRWLRPLNRAERPHGSLAIEPPVRVIRDKGLHGQIIAFANPVTRQEANFTSNARSGDGTVDAISGGMAIIGYFRNYYQNISVVNLQFSCETTRKDIHLRLDAKENGPFGKPIARFNKAYLPQLFVQRINDELKGSSDKNAIFIRSLLPPPLGNKGTTNATPPAQNQ